MFWLFIYFFLNNKIEILKEITPCFLKDEPLFTNIPPVY